LANLGGKKITEIALPIGWAWASLPVPTVAGVLHMNAFDGRSVNAWQTKMRALREWAEKYDLNPFRTGSQYLFTDEYQYYVPTNFKIKTTGGVQDFLKKFFDDVACRECDTLNEPLSTKCTNCACTLVCAFCGGTGPAMSRDDDVTFCAYCAGSCTFCKKACDPNYTSCCVCRPRARCGACRNRLAGDQIVEVVVTQRTEQNEPILPGNTRKFCQPCSAFCCANCGSYFRPTQGMFTEALDGDVCRTCFDRFFDIYKDVREDFEPDELPATQLLVPSMEGREKVRDVGIEIEGGGSGNKLSRALFDGGLCPWKERSDRHGAAGTHDYPVHVEHDASVDWEMVIARFNPSKIEEMRKVNSILKIAREQIKAGNTHLDLRCGCHIHVDASKYNLKSAFNLWALFAYTEDLFFRIGSAKWSVHRTLKYGRQNGASVPVPKGPFRNVIEFGNALANGAADRYFALSFATFWNSVHRRCVCGAVRYGAWEDCTCDLGKCTFEFRVFNSTLNPRKLHAYIALSQALVAKGATMDEIDVNKFPPMEWDPRPVSKLSDGEKQEKSQLWQERLTWMFTELPLTENERESLAYCVRNSSMAELLSDEFTAGLTTEARLVAVV